MNKNNIIYYLMLFMIIGIVFSLLEGAIIMCETLSTISEKLFWSAMNAMLFIGCPVGVLCIVKLSETDDERLHEKGLI